MFSKLPRPLTSIPSSQHTSQNTMSNVQQYLFTVDGDKGKALSIAQDTARGMLLKGIAHDKVDLSRARVKAVDTDRGRPIVGRVHQ